MIYRYRTFLTWLVYAAIASTGWLVAYSYGLPQLVLAHDTSHLSALLLVTYAIAEILSFRQVIVLTKAWNHSDELDMESVLVGEFLSEQIVLVGILGTIVGVIMAFWPFLSLNGDVDAMRSHMGAFFSGVATAFIPTALSFVLKIALDFNSRILIAGMRRLGYE